MAAGILLGLFCVLVGFTLGLWVAWLYWRDRFWKHDWQQACEQQKVGV